MYGEKISRGAFLSRVLGVGGIAMAAPVLSAGVPGEEENDDEEEDD